MVVQKTKRIILFISLFGFGLFLAANIILFSISEEEKIMNPINRNIRLIEEAFDRDFLNLLLQNRPDEPLTFTNLSIQSGSPYFIYSEEGRLVYWSDFTTLPSFDLIDPRTNQRILEDNTGIYFSKVRRFSRNNRGYWLIQVYPIYFKRDFQNQYLQSGFNKEVFPTLPVSVSQEVKEGYFHVTNERGDFLFALSFDDDVFPVRSANQLALMVFFFSLLVLIIILTYSLVRAYWSSKQYLKATFTLFAVLSSLRLLMLYFKFPRAFFDFRLFDPSLYASSWLSPSMGDLLVNVLCLALVTAMIFRVLTTVSVRKNFARLQILKSSELFLFLGFLFSTLFLWFFYILYLDIFTNSALELNILSLPSFDLFQFVSLLVIFLCAAGYFTASILLIGLSFVNGDMSKKRGMWFLVAFSFPFLLVLGYYDWIALLIFITHLIFLLVVVRFGLFKFLYQAGLNTFLAFFFACLMSGVIAGLASHQVYLLKDNGSKKNFGIGKLVENDLLAEFFLADAMGRIEEDVFIKYAMIDPLISKESIEKKIRRIHLNNYFDQYAVRVKVFNSIGENILQRGERISLEDLRKRYVKSDYLTEVRDLYFINKAGEADRKSYFSFVPIYKENQYLGTVFMELVQLRLLSGSVFPKLLLDEKYVPADLDRKFDYAVFEDAELRYGVGIFNYRAANLVNDLDDNVLYEKGLYRRKYHHVGIREGDRVIVVSSPVYPIYYILADISLFFLGFVIFTLIGFLASAVYRQVGRYQLNLSTKLQLYLNFAFFVPILIISVIIIGIFTNSYQDELHRQYLQKASIIRDNLAPTVELLLDGQVSRDGLQEIINNLSGNTNADINLYGTAGRLISTSQPNIFEKKVKTSYINPLAIAELLEGQNNLVLLPESIGSLNFKSVYAAIRSIDGQEALAIVAVPFFESESELDFLIADVLSNIINIFVLVFIVFLVISYFVSKNLTLPFKVLTQKIKTTGIDNTEPMFWPRNDEIGMLVREYNNMLFKLEESKKDLANSEKELAWREMAKQVAHEIKNPLTPMKLTLQHLLRLQSEGKLSDPRQLRQPVETLIHQVDTLSDIANSFSSFAKMPMPKKELMDFKTLVLASLELFKNRENEKVIFGDLTERDRLPVMGDKQLFGRIISNLIINGFQALDPNKKAVIHLFLRVIEGQVVLEVRDNGKGIPVELRNKIFMPNFSTKTDGSGLGLAIAKRGVETEGGKIWFETEEGRGTSFFLAFDLVHENGKEKRISNP